ncbi:hypothetical protein FIU83_07680 [Halomonas sp. THAF5a]|uniref:hypothetical protein n=1 Tax=Halomonas sp. THAF5a TaxID=2587844 RepID=UPI00126796AB|nr:hypothetical protein [Halomonas sp. THAF5a]QFU01519.1 hypothetical protein FIU83_07680 [Halomonas sp. THAF5a]
MNPLGGVFLFLGLSLSSFYLLPSGLPQPGDILLLPFIAIMLLMSLRDDRGLMQHPFVLAWLAMVVWVTLVSLGWSVIDQDAGYLRYPLFFLFNFLLGAGLLRFLTAVPEGIRWVRLAVMIALLVAFGGVVLDLALGRIRATGTLNNPNQLAYFSLCALVMLLASHGFRLPLRPLPMAAMGAAVTNILAASSLAAMGGLCLVMLSWALFHLGRLRHLLRLVLLVPLLVLALVGFDAWTGGRVEQNITQRFERAPDKVEGIYAHRKYQRMVEFPGYNLLGAGEGNTERFRPYHGNEIHSSFGTMLFSYGVPGLALFLSVLLAAVWRTPPHVWLALSGPLLYSVTHNGLRTTLFWLVLVVLWHSQRHFREQQAAARPAPSASVSFPWSTES